jgi:hypothetical protein
VKCLALFFKRVTFALVAPLMNNVTQHVHSTTGRMSNLSALIQGAVIGAGASNPPRDVSHNVHGLA